jgi:hypothetical protein
MRLVGHGGRGGKRCGGGGETRNFATAECFFFSFFMSGTFPGFRFKAEIDGTIPFPTRTSLKRPLVGLGAERQKKAEINPSGRTKICAPQESALSNSIII